MIDPFQLGIDVEYYGSGWNGIQTALGWPLLLIVTSRMYKAYETRLAIAVARNLDHLLRVKVVQAGDAFARVPNISAIPVTFQLL